jgi:hypothetical protein
MSIPLSRSAIRIPVPVIPDELTSFDLIKLYAQRLFSGVIGIYSEVTSLSKLSESVPLNGVEFAGPAIKEIVIANAMGKIVYLGQAESFNLFHMSVRKIH